MPIRPRSGSRHVVQGIAARPERPLSAASRAAPGRRGGEVLRTRARSVSSRPPSATRPSGRSWSGPGLFRAQARSV